MKVSASVDEASRYKASVTIICKKCGTPLSLEQDVPTYDMYACPKCGAKYHVDYNNVVKKFEIRCWDDDMFHMTTNNASFKPMFTIREELITATNTLHSKDLLPKYLLSNDADFMYSTSIPEIMCDVDEHRWTHVNDVNLASWTRHLGCSNCGMEIFYAKGITHAHQFSDPVKNLADALDKIRIDHGGFARLPADGRSVPFPSMRTELIRELIDEITDDKTHTELIKKIDTLRHNIDTKNL